MNVKLANNICLEPAKHNRIVRLNGCEIGTVGPHPDGKGWRVFGSLTPLERAMRFATAEQAATEVIRRRKLDG